MTEKIETVIVGGGQAGLALSRALSEAGCEHVVLERGRVAERWRSERWDSFRLLTPNWMTRLSGARYAGKDPDGFMNRDQVVDFFPPPDVRFVKRRRATGPGDELHGPLAALGRLFGDIRDDEARPFAGKHDRDRATDPGARAGDDSYLAGK